MQEPGEPFEHFVRDLKTQAGLCNFGDLRDSMIRDQIVFGIQNDKLREKLLRNTSLTLQKAEQSCKAAEATPAQQEIWLRDHQVDPIRNFSAPGRHHQEEKQRNSNARKPPDYICSRCARTHAPRKCPAFGRPCHNHFAVCCEVGSQTNGLTGDEESFDVLNVSSRSKVSGRDWLVRTNVKLESLHRLASQCYSLEFRHQDAAKTIGKIQLLSSTFLRRQ